MNMMIRLSWLLFAVPVFATAQTSTDWGYLGDTGPENWAGLDPAYTVCDSGKNQSPVNVVGMIDGNLPALDPQYLTGGQIISNDGRSIKVIYDPGSSLLLGEESVQLEEIRFHSPSEHTIQTYSYPLEAQFHHVDKNGRKLVMSVMFQPGEHNAELAKAWEHLPTDSGQSRALEQPLDAGKLLPMKTDYYRYNGSLTTPPCTEGVSWLVLKFYNTASPEQIVALARALHIANNRPVQDLNARIIIE